MMPVIYDVAVSADGYIAGAFDDVSAFPKDGLVVQDFLERLGGYSCAVMGRRSYELGYDTGLRPGSCPYPGMQNILISSGITLPEGHAVDLVRRNVGEAMQLLRATQKTPVYLSGGGTLAGWLMSHGLIDILRVSRMPVFLGSGTRLFGNYEAPLNTRLVETRFYEDGSLFQEFEVHG